MQKRMTSLLLAAALLLSSLPAARAAETIDSDANTGAGTASASANFSSAVVRNRGAAAGTNGTAQQLEVEVRLKSFGAEKPVFAVAVKRSEYDAALKGQLQAKIKDSTYGQLDGLTPAYYAIGRKNVASAAEGDTVTLPLVEASTANMQKLQAGQDVPYKSMPKAQVSGTNYFDVYRLIVFSQDAGDGDQMYYTDDFYVDADGYVRTDSYLIRYLANNPAAGTGSVKDLPTRQIERAKPEEALAATATLSSAKPARTGYAFVGWTTTKQDPLAADAPAPESGFYAAGAVYAQPETLHTVYDLYALWRVVPLKFDGAHKALSYTGANVPQVGVPFTDAAKAFASPTPAGNKKYEITGETHGLKVETVAETGNAKWHLAGTPTTHSAGAQVVWTVKATDLSNDTSDEITVTFAQVKPGVQDAPLLDWNTALQGRVSKDAEGAEIGQLIGFFSPNEGAPSYAGKIYEYVPKSVYDEALAEAGEDEEKRAALDALWRAVELPQEDDAPWPESYGSVEAAPAADAGDWVLRDAAEDAPAPLQITGLPKDTEYYVRFRALTNYVASPHVILSTSGAASGGGAGGASGYSVIFHLAGGDFPTEGEGENAVQKKFELVHGGLKTGDKVKIPAIEPVREGYSFEGWTDGASIYRYDAEAETPVAVEVKKASVTLAAKWVSTTDGFVSVTCFDWDNTLLGSVTVPKGASEEVVLPYIRDFEKSLMSPESKDYDDTKSAYFVDDAAYPLTYKRGYSFDLWLKYESTAPTHWGRGMDSFNELISLPQPDASEHAVFENLQGNITIKTCYRANDELLYTEDSNKMTNMFYSVEVDHFDRIGNSINYPITVTVRRKNVDIADGLEKGVPRLISPVLRVIMQTDAGAIYSFYSLDTSDTASVEFIPTNAVNSIECNVMDFYGVVIKSTASVKAQNLSILAGSNTQDDAGFIFYGTHNFIDSQIRINDSTGINNAVLRTQGGLTYTTNAATAFANLRAAWEKKNASHETETGLKPESEWNDLTFDEKNYALQNNGAWILSRP